MYEEKQSSSKQVLLSVLAVAILVVAVVGVSFAFFTYSKQGETENVINTGTLVFSYSENSNGIQLTNALPLTDAQVTTENVLDNASSNHDGDKGEFEFEVTSTLQGNITIDYDIVVAETTDPAADKTLDAKYVRMRLLKDEGSKGEYSTVAKEPTFFKALTEAKDDQKISADGVLYDQRVLASGSFTSTGEKANSTHFYKFQMWISDYYYDANGEYGNASYKTEMTNDVCQEGKESEAQDGTCQEGQIKTKGTNGKEFKVKVNVVARDKAD